MTGNQFHDRELQRETALAVPLERTRESDAELTGPKRKLMIHEWQPVFLSCYAATGNMRYSCQQAGIDRGTVKKFLESSDTFKARFDDAQADAIEGLEAVAWQRARSGSDFLLWRLMQSLRPEVYGDKRTVEHKFSQSERRSAYKMAKDEGLSDEEAREAVAAAEDMLRQSRGRGS